MSKGVRLLYRIRLLNEEQSSSISISIMERPITTWKVLVEYLEGNDDIYMDLNDDQRAEMFDIFTSKYRADTPDVLIERASKRK